jgi:hypothetical protein
MSRCFRLQLCATPIRDEPAKFGRNEKQINQFPTGELFSKINCFLFFLFLFILCVRNLFEHAACLPTSFRKALGIQNYKHNKNENIEREYFTYLERKPITGSGEAAERMPRHWALRSNAN